MRRALGKARLSTQEGELAWRGAEEGGVCPRRECGPCRGDPEGERRKQTCPKAS